MGLYLGIDAGTSGIRACVIDESRQPVAEAALPFPVSSTGGLGTEQEPRDWWQTCCTLLEQLFSQSVNPSRITALAVDGTSTTCLVCDEHGSPRTTALMYNDSRARRQAERLSGLAPIDSPARGPTSSLSKLMWFADNGHLHANDHFLHQADWLTGQFLNNFSVSDENNALKLGYDSQQRRWQAWLDGIGLPPGVLPTVYPAGTRLGWVCESVQARFGLPADCLVAAGTTDSTAACLAAGISRPGDAVTVLGSTLVMKVLSEKPVFAPEYGIYSHRLGDLWLVGGASNSGGAVLSQYFGENELDSLSLDIDPQADSGLDYYPLPGPGERFPFNDPDLPPRLVPRPASGKRFLHGLLEGMARIEALAYERLVELGAPVPTGIRSIGGGARNVTWEKIRERITGIPMLTATFRQPACGTALLALQCAEHAHDNKD